MDVDDKVWTSATAKGELEAIGGVVGLRTGEWFPNLLKRSLRAYVKNANARYLRAKYPKMSDDAIATKLISIAARNAALIGGTAGAAVSADEIATLASLGFTLPGNVAIAIGAVGIEIVSVTNIQLRLIASLAGLYGEPLDPDDPEDILLVIKYFLLGKTSDVVQVGGTKVGQGLARTTVKVVFSREMLKAVQDYGKKAGLKILQKTLVNVAVPVVSIGLSASSNYVFTRTLGRKAGKDMKARAGEIARHKTDIVPPMPLIEDLPTVY